MCPLYVFCVPACARDDLCGVQARSAAVLEQQWCAHLVRKHLGRVSMLRGQRARKRQVAEPCLCCFCSMTGVRCLDVTCEVQLVCTCGTQRLSDVAAAFFGKLSAQLFGQQSSVSWSCRAHVPKFDGFVVRVVLRISSEACPRNLTCSNKPASAGDAR